MSHAILMRNLGFLCVLELFHALERRKSLNPSIPAVLVGFSVPLALNLYSESGSRLVWIILIIHIKLFIITLFNSKNQ